MKIYLKISLYSLSPSNYKISEGGKYSDASHDLPPWVEHGSRADHYMDKIPCA